MSLAVECRFPTGRRFSGFGAALAGAVAAAILLAPPAAAEDKVVPETREAVHLSFAPLVRKVAPAVVNIYARRIVQRRASPLLEDPVFRRFFGDNPPRGLRRERVENSLGSGVLVRADGLIVTANHVIANASEITVVLADRREYPARIVTSDQRTDLALVRIDPAGEDLPTIELKDSDDLEVGDLVLAIGNPFGVGQTVTGGIVSALARTAEGVSDYSFFIQTDAAINPGNSGGALVAMDGRLVGINSAIYSRSGGSIGIGFAIPSNMVTAVIASEAHGGRVVRAWLGAAGETVNADIARSLGMKRPTGVIVSRLYPGGPAERGGLRVGDVVTEIDGEAVNDVQELRFRVATLTVGEQATFTILRGGKEAKLVLALAPAPETPAREATRLAGRNPLAGATVANMSPALSEEIQVDSLRTGVVVVEVARDSAAARLGLRRGDFVAEVNGARIDSIGDLKSALAGDAKRWELAIRRGGRTLSVVVGG
ncbi:MAG TPA: DegQ family serine endoprotease [Alphaproteobacteria bacterium]